MAVSGRRQFAAFQREITQDLQKVLRTFSAIPETDSLHSVRYPLYVCHVVVFSVSTTCFIFFLGTWTYSLGLEGDDGLYYYKSSTRYAELTLKYFGAAFCVFCLTVAILSFVAIIGILRENIGCLRFFFVGNLLLMIFEVIIAFLAADFDKDISSAVLEKIVYLVLTEYMDNLVFKSFYDDVQRHFQCCGVGMDGFHDWARLPGRICLEDTNSALRCKVPVSCCNMTTVMRKPQNLACTGYVLLAGSADLSETIYVDGCISAFLWRFGKGILMTKIAILVIPLPLQFYMSCCVFILSDHFRWIEKHRKRRPLGKCISTVHTLTAAM